MAIKVLVIIPAYNEKDNIQNTIQSFIMAKEHLHSQIDIDYVVINDCSTDNTLQILKAMNANYLNLPINLGIGGAMQTGYIYAWRNNYDIAVQLDGDGQHIPQYIDNLLEPIIKDGVNVVIGSRFLNKEGFQSSMTRRIGINFLSNLIHLCCGCKVKDVTSGFRASDRKAIELFVREYAQDYPEPEAIISCALSGLNVVETPVVMKERSGGVSSISSFRSIYYMVKVTIAIILQRTFARKVGK